MGSGIAVKAAIAKYGIDSFIKELLTYASSYDELNKIEVDLITKERNAGKAEYNLHIGSPVPKDARACKNMSAEEKEAVYKALAEKTKERNRLKYESIISLHKESILSLYDEYKNYDKVAKNLEISRHYVSRFLKENGVTLNYQNIEGRTLDQASRKRISDGLKKSSVKFQLTCNICGSAFESKTIRRKRCENCFHIIPKYNTSSKTEKTAKRGRTPVPVIIKICTICEKEFERKPSKASKFCSKECAVKNNRKVLPSIEVISKLYWEDSLSANQIGTMYEVSGQTIRKYMKRNGINRREERRSP